MKKQTEETEDRIERHEVAGIEFTITRFNQPAAPITFWEKIQDLSWRVWDIFVSFVLFCLLFVAVGVCCGIIAIGLALQFGLFAIIPPLIFSVVYYWVLYKELKR